MTKYDSRVSQSTLHEVSEGGFVLILERICVHNLIVKHGINTSAKTRNVPAHVGVSASL